MYNKSKIYDVRNYLIDIIVSSETERVYTFSQTEELDLFEEHNGGDNSFDEDDEDLDPSGLALIDNVQNKQKVGIELSLSLSHQSIITTNTNTADTNHLIDSPIQENIDISTKDNYEETRIMGMTVSQQGFCVLLQGLISDRILKVLVTPEDPMADGLDRDEVETSEAVTLLQLLQDIDVETYLAKDALAMKFGGDSKHKYTLQHIVIDEVDPSKGFKGTFSAIQKRVDNIENGISLAMINAQTTADLVSNDEIQLKNMNILPSSIDINHPSNNQFTGLTNPLIVNSKNAESKASSSFYAIALALRHHAAIEVRSDLLYDTNLSYNLDELKIAFPKMVECSLSFIPKIETRDEKYLLERYRKRLYEAIRQKKDEKIKQIEQLLLMYDPETLKLKSFAFNAIHNDNVV